MCIKSFTFRKKQTINKIVSKMDVTDKLMVCREMTGRVSGTERHYAKCHKKMLVNWISGFK